MIAACRDLRDSATLKRKHLLRHLGLVLVPVTALPLVVGLAPAAPCEHSSILIEGHGVEISAVHLDDSGVLINQRLNKLRLERAR